MKLNKDMVLEYMQHCVDQDPDNERKFTTLELSNELNMQRTNLSTLLNQLVKEGVVKKISGRPVYYQLTTDPGINQEDSCFQKLIGYDGSLKNVIQLAKAMILYPKETLSVFLLGPSGSGKSYFASLMYEFAIEKKVLSANAPFIKVNCRSYVGDHAEEEMHERIFSSDKNESALYQAKGGVLFIDHVDLLPMHTRDKILDVIENKKKEILNTIIILSADNKTLNKRLQDLFASKFSICITLPSLSARNLEERLHLVQHFFIHEAINMKQKIKINSELLRCILLYPCEQNIKQIKNDIRLGCANAYIRQHDKPLSELFIYMSDFPSYVRKGFLFYKENKAEINRLVPANYTYTFSEENMKKTENTNYLSIKASSSVYDVIDHKINELRSRGISEEDIGRIVNADLESDFRYAKKKMINNKINKDTISKIVDAKIVSMVDRFLQEASSQFGKAYSQSIFYGLCLHLSGTLERMNSNQKLQISKITEIIQNYKDEYVFCNNFALEIEKEYGLTLSIDEVVFITMFITDYDDIHQSETQPVILIASHGSSAASSIAETINELTKNDNTFAFDLPLEKEMKEAYEEMKRIISEINRGKGILLLYDMGSLKTMANMVMEETGIPIRMINIPMTLLGIDCSRKASSVNDLDELYAMVSHSLEGYYSSIGDNYQRSITNNVIITLCMSGKGGAIQVKKYIENNLTLENTTIIPLAISNRTLLTNEISAIKKEHHIQCVVGTYDPQLHGIPFISISKLFETSKDKLAMLLSLDNNEIDIETSLENLPDVFEYLEDQFNDFDIAPLKKYLPKFLHQLEKKHDALSTDQKIGLLLHIACNVYALVNHESPAINYKKETILNKHKRLYNDLIGLLEPIEEAYQIHFNDDEIANIISIIKKIR